MSSEHTPGELIVVCSKTMYAGKTERLEWYLRRYSVIGQKMCIITHINDTRFDNDDLSLTKSHGGTVIKVTRVDNLGNLDEAWLEAYDVIGIDEGQMFADLLSFVQKWHREKGKGMVVAGLTTYANDEKWGNMSDLCLWPSKPEYLHAICQVCKKGQAVATRYHAENAPLFKIGGLGDYYVVCHLCDPKYKKAE